MPYTITGSIEIEPPLMQRHIDYLQKFSRVRHPERRADCLERQLKAEDITDTLREAVRLPIGTEGEFYLGGDSEACYEDWEAPAGEQPSLFCLWDVTDDGTEIFWRGDGSRSGRHPAEWMDYIVENFIRRWGYAANGRAKMTGDRTGATTIIRVRDNNVDTVAVTEEVA